MKKVLYLVYLLAIIACNREKKVANHKEQVVTEIQLPEADKAVYAEMPSSEEHANETRNKPIDQKIIKNATLRFETADISKTASVIISEIKKYNGFIESDNETKDYNSFSRRITVRVPNKFFENILNETTKGITYFDEKVITAQDVTSQYIDIEARLKAKRALENRYLELLRKATKVSDMLEIEKELLDIREEIESNEQQLLYLQNRVSMSTIQYTFYKPIVTTGVTVSYGDKIVNSLVSSVRWIPGFFLVLLKIWPFIALVSLIIILLRRRRKKKVNQE